MRVQPGQILVRRKLGPFEGWHYGTAVDGATVFHSTPERGCHYSSLHSFASGHPVGVFPTEVSSMQEYAELVNKTRMLEGASYNPLFNCEDVTSLVRYDHPHSPTRNKVALLVLAAVGLVVAVKAMK
jgi:hypothetical protein